MKLERLYQVTIGLLTGLVYTAQKYSGLYPAMKNVVSSLTEVQDMLRHARDKDSRGGKTVTLKEAMEIMDTVEMKVRALRVELSKWSQQDKQDE
jgi:hypothetical protein|tara:strand:+ start:640 stop:921 length:282 start_codon:yes stop_codon:yes gene_type:complete